MVDAINDVTHNARIVEIYDAYINTISPFILQLETLGGEFPVEILNEIRAIFTYIARSSLTDTPSERSSRLSIFLAKTSTYILRSRLGTRRGLFALICQIFWIDPPAEGKKRAGTRNAVKRPCPHSRLL